MFIVFKFLAVLVAISGIFGFADYTRCGGAITLPITVSIGVLIFALACMLERIAEEIRKKNESNKQDNPEEKK